MAALSSDMALGLQGRKLPDLAGGHAAVDLRALGAEPLGPAGSGFQDLGPQVRRG